VIFYFPSLFWSQRPCLFQFLYKFYICPSFWFSCLPFIFCNILELELMSALLLVGDAGGEFSNSCVSSENLSELQLKLPLVYHCELTVRAYCSGENTCSGRWTGLEGNMSQLLNRVTEFHAPVSRFSSSVNCFQTPPCSFFLTGSFRNYVLRVLL
jgi:hypothetical protein